MSGGWVREGGAPPLDWWGEILDGRRCNLGIYLRKMKLLIGLRNAGFLGWSCVPLKEKLKKSKLQSKCHKIRTDWQCHSKHLASWFFIHYRKSVTSNTFQFRDDSESKSAINKTFCGHRLHWFKKTVTFQFTNFYFYFWQICRRRSTRSSRWNRRSPAHFENPAGSRQDGFYVNFP